MNNQKIAQKIFEIKKSGKKLTVNKIVKTFKISKSRYYRHIKPILEDLEFADEMAQITTKFDSMKPARTYDLFAIVNISIRLATDSAEATGALGYRHSKPYLEAIQTRPPTSEIARDNILTVDRYDSRNDIKVLKLDILDKGKEEPFWEDRSLTFNIKAKNIPSLISHLREELRQELNNIVDSVPGTGTFGGVLGMRFHDIELKLQKPGSRETSIYLLDSLTQYQWANNEYYHKDKYSCVEQYFLSFKKLKKAKDYFNNKNSMYYLDVDKLREIANPKLIDGKYGYNIVMVKDICRHYRLSMFAFDIDGEPICHYIPEKNNPVTRKKIAFCIADDHFYPIKSNLIREYIKRAMVSHRRINSNLIKRTYYAAENDAVNTAGFNPRIIKIKKKTIDLLPQEELNAVFESDKAIGFSTKNDNITKVAIKDQIFGLKYHNKHDELMDDYDKVGIAPSYSPNPAELGRKLMPDLSQIIPLRFRKIFDSAPQMTMCRINEPVENMEAYDIIGHYRNALNNDFMRFDLTSRLEKYDESKKQTGYFLGYHKGRNGLPDLGWTWCPYKEDLTQIKYVYTSSLLLKKPFEEFSNNVKNLNHMKSITNHAIGLLGKRKQVNQEAFKTTSSIQAFYLFKKGYKIRKLNNTYVAIKETNMPLYRISTFIRSQIIWHAYKNLEKLAGKFEYICSIHTDSIYGIPKDVEFSKKLYRVDKPHFLQGCTAIAATYKLELKDLLIDDIEKKESESSMILGLAGYGKTRRLLEKIEQYPKEDVIRLSPTNLNAFRIKGQTIERYAGKFTHRSKVYAIDETAMCSYQDLEILYILKMKNPTAIFIGSGDNKQLRNPDGFNVYCHSLFEIFDHNIETLDTNRRNDLDYSNNYTLADFKICKEFPDFHLCFFNKTRKKVNQIMMDKYKTNSILIKHDITNQYGQDVYLYDSLPLRMVHNLPKKELFNGMMTTYKQLRTILKDNEIMKYAVPAYCLTLYGIQGETITTKYCIHDANYIFSNPRFKYVAISRCTKKDNIEIYDDLRCSMNQEHLLNN